jgi:hypothetical protein
MWLWYKWFYCSGTCPEGLRNTTGMLLKMTVVSTDILTKGLPVKQEHPRFWPTIYVSNIPIYDSLMVKTSDSIYGLFY